MGRAPKYTAEELVKHATALAAIEGPGAVTMVGVAEAAGAPSGSVYHRFDSRPHLLAEVWRSCLEAFQQFWWARAEGEQNPAEVAVLPVQWARRHRELAGVLLVHSAEHFVVDDCPAATRTAITGMQRKTAKQLGAMAERFLGRSDREAMERTTLALTGIPLAVIRRPLTRGGPITQTAESLVRESAACLMRTPST